MLFVYMLHVHLLRPVNQKSFADLSLVMKDYLQMCMYVHNLSESVYINLCFSSTRCVDFETSFYFRELIQFVCVYVR